MCILLAPVFTIQEFTKAIHWQMDKRNVVSSKKVILFGL
jgi:hypothetical protein